MAVAEAPRRFAWKAEIPVLLVCVAIAGVAVFLAVQHTNGLSKAGSARAALSQAAVAAERYATAHHGDYATLAGAGPSTLASYGYHLAAPVKVEWAHPTSYCIELHSSGAASPWGVASILSGDPDPRAGGC